MIMNLCFFLLFAFIEGLLLLLFDYKDAPAPPPFFPTPPPSFSLPSVCLSLALTLCHELQ